LTLVLGEALEDPSLKLGEDLRLKELAPDSVQQAVLEHVSPDPKVVGARSRPPYL
jgi:hypothetical protein